MPHIPLHRSSMPSVGGWSRQSCARTGTTRIGCTGSAPSGGRHALGTDAPGGRTRLARGRTAYFGCRDGHPGNAHTRAFSGVDVPLRPGDRPFVLRGHPLLGWAGRNGAFLFRLPDDHRFDQGSAVLLARGDEGVHRARRRHQHRRGVSAPRRMDQARQLMPRLCSTDRGDTPLPPARTRAEPSA